MPIVITPTGEYINSETGNPVNLPPQRPDIPQTMGQQTGAALTPEEINMGRENIPTNMDMGMDSMMRNPTGSALTEGIFNKSTISSMNLSLCSSMYFFTSAIY